MKTRFFFLYFVFLASSYAGTNPSPVSVVNDAVAESVPTAFAPNTFTVRDYTLEWMDPAPAGVTARLEANSLQWVRVSDLLLIPRAALVITLDPSQGATSGVVRSGSITHHLSPATADHPTSTEIPVALVSGEKDNPIELLLAGSNASVKLRVRFRPKRTIPLTERVLFDASCSRFGLNYPPEAQFPDAQWMYVGCRSVLTEGNHVRFSELELRIFWDGASSDTIEINGSKVLATSPLYWVVRLGSSPGKVEVRAPASIDFNYAIADHFKPGFLGVGIGPYSYFNNQAGDSIQTYSPLLTIYGSYFISETSRFVFFDATALNSTRPFTDLGFYFGTESSRALDRRMTVNVFLGGHAMIFKAYNQTYMRFGVPQGAEMIYSDFLERGKNLSAGGFVYPPIGGKMYYNFWLRWGSQIFAEINYINWVEQAQSADVHARSLGATVGFPLL